MTKRQLRKNFELLRLEIVREMEFLRHNIDSLGELGTQITGDEYCDMNGCFASNCLYGVDSLVREISRVVRKAYKNS